MPLTSTFIAVFITLFGAVYSSPHRTYNNTNPPVITASPLSYEYNDADLTSHTFGDLVQLAADFKELRNASAQPHLNSKSRRKRSVFNLLSMVGCATKCNRLYLMSYGSYCGWGGAGIAIDDTDRCCKQHDFCYQKVLDDYNKWSISIYFKSYEWYCNSGEPYCGRYQDEWRHAACRCDLQLTECLNKFGCPQWF